MEETDLMATLESIPHTDSLMHAVKSIASNVFMYSMAVDASDAFEYVEHLKKLVSTPVPIDKVKEACSNSPECCKELCSKFYEYCADNTEKLQNASETCAKLDALYIDQIKSIGTLMVANAIASVLQSVKGWASVAQFQIPNYEDEVAEARAYIERAASTLTPMLETNTPNYDVLNRIDDWLLSAYNILQRISKDLEKKIVEARKLRSNNFLSAVTNVAAMVTNYLSYQALAAHAVGTSLKAVAIGSNVAHGICTIGDLIATGKAHTLVSQLNGDLAKIKQLQTQRQTLAAQVRTLR